MFLFFMLSTACTDKTAQKIKEDTRSQLWHAQNTVLLFEKCQKSMKQANTIQEDQPAEAVEKDLLGNINTCEKFKDRLNEAREICTGTFAENIANPKAPNSDPEYITSKNQLQKICRVIAQADAEPTDPETTDTQPSDSNAQPSKDDSPEKETPEDSTSEKPK